MHIVAGLLLVLALLYFWLIGHWFARIVTTLVFLAGFGGLGAVVVSNSMDHPNPGNAVFGAIAGALIGWVVASLPTWYWRAESRRLSQAAQHVWDPHSGRWV